MKRNKSFEVKEMETRSPLPLQGMKKYSIISAVRKNEPYQKRGKQKKREEKEGQIWKTLHLQRKERTKGDEIPLNKILSSNQIASSD